MSKPLTITLLAAGALVGLLALVAVAVLLFVDKKSRLEAAASEALGMDVNVGGRAGIHFFPDLHVTLEDVHMQNRGADVVSAERAYLGIDRLPLPFLKVRFEKIVLERYRILIERDVEGKFNYEPEWPEGVFPALDLVKVSFLDGTLHYADKQSGRGFEAADCNLDVAHARHSGGKRSDLLKTLSITVEFDCGEIRNKEDFALSDLKFSLNGKDGIFEFEPVTMRVFGGQGSGSVQVDRSGPVPRVHARYSLLKFRIEEFLKTLSPEEVAAGPMDFSMNLTMQGMTTNDLRQTANGEVSLVGENLTLDGRDLDAELSRYKFSQSFNLVDMGAFFFAGPIGLAVTKGYNFTSLFRRSGGSTRIRTLVSNWKVERGVAHAKDVALATNKNRLALKGELDFVNEEFKDVTVAQVDAKGCPKVRQRILGPFLKPVVEKPNFLKSIAGPAIKLIKRARALFPGGKCEVFYEGSVAPPE